MQGPCRRGAGSLAGISGADCRIAALIGALIGDGDLISGPELILLKM
jgi:hypothetical protein